MSASRRSVRKLGVLADRDRLREANLNPETGLATDYLNRFNEAVMLLELVHDDPSCASDLASWQPASYADHFARSGFKHRDFAIKAYLAAPQPARRRLDEISETMTTIVLKVREALSAVETTPTLRAALVEEALSRLRPLLSEASAVIHGVPVKPVETDHDGQDEVDAVFARRLPE